MKIALENHTAFRTDDLRKLVRGALKAAGWAPTKEWAGAKDLRVEVRQGRTTGVSGMAHIGRSAKNPGTWMLLRIPKPGLWTEQTWRRVVLVTVHEAMHLVGARHSDMTEIQRDCSGPLPTWAHGLELRALAPVVPPLLGERQAAARGDRLEHARAMLKKAETREKRSTTIRKKWQRRVVALQRRTW